jgi:intracellular sulfur oxidation DsrE/DsrF family protein
VDGELAGGEEARVLDAIQRDPELAREVADLRHAKHLVRHAYGHALSAPRQHGYAIPNGRRWLAAAAVALIAIGAGAGWTGHSLVERGEDGENRWLARHAAMVAQQASSDRVLLHVSSSAPDRLTALLDDAEGMLRAARASGRTVAIEIVANNTGLDVLRLDAAGNAARLAALHAEYPNLTLVACAQTLERLREKGIEARLVPDASVAASALDQIVKRIHEGWTYVRT